MQKWPERADCRADQDCRICESVERAPGRPGGQPTAQDEKIRQYCSLYDLTLVDIVIDAGVSAKTLQREGLQEALCMLISGQADGIVVVKLDKLTRNVSDRGSLIQNYFNTYALMSVSEQVNTRPASGR